MDEITVFNTHCCGEIGDVIVAGNVSLKGNNTLEKSKFLLEDKKLRKVGAKIKRVS